jgi:hypothetical protein
MAKQLGKGFIRGQQATEPATPQGRAVKRANANNPQVARPGETASVPHDSRSGIDKAVSATRRLAPSSHGGTAPITQGPPSSRPPRKAL